MAITPLCTNDDLEAIWSTYGVEVRADDDDAHSSDAMIDAAIEKATADVTAYLFQTYPVAAVAASTWAKWCVALFACVNLGRRRGNGAPQSMLDEYNRYLEMLKLIASGAMALPADDGLAAPEFDNTPGVSNLRVDSRFRANIRRIPQTSTKSPQSPQRKGHESVGSPWPYFS